MKGCAMRSFGVVAAPPCLLLVLAGWAAAEDARFRHVRPIEVESAGWIRVALDGPAQLHGRPERDWRILDPDGRELPVLVLEPVREEVSLETLSVSEDGEAGGYLVEFDVGLRPSRHRRIRVELGRQVNAGGCILEASPDRRAWREIARGDLFRLGGGEGLRRSTIEYAPTELRYLRLRWPRDAGFPELRAASVEPADELPGVPARVGIPAEDAPAPPAAAGAILRIPRGRHLPGGFPLVALELEVDAPGDVAAAVDRADRGRWLPLAASVLAGGAGTRTLRIAPLEAAGGSSRGAGDGSETLRVRLFAKAGEDVHPGESARILSAAAVLPPLWVLFEARTAGTHKLVCGAWTPPSGASSGASPAPALDRIAPHVADAVLGEAREPPPPPLPREAAGLAPPSREPWAARSWRVLAAGASPGEIVRLELPDPVVDELAEVRGSLRLRLADRDVPFVRWAPDEPALILERKDVDPVPDDGAAPGRTSRVALDLPPGAQALSAVTLGAPERVIARRVVAAVERTHRPGVEGSEVVVASEEWDCPEDRGTGLEGTGLLPCEAVLLVPSLPRSERGRLTLTFHDGDREPLRGLRVALWRRRDRIAFPWPEGAGPGGTGPGAEPRLLVVSDGERAQARTTLDLFRERVLDLPWKEARLDLEGATAAERAAEAVRRWWLVAALAVASGVLLWVLARSLGRGGDGRSGGRTSGSPGSTEPEAGTGAAPEER